MYIDTAQAVPIQKREDKTMNENQKELDQNELQIDVEQLEIDTLALIPVIREGRHEAKIERIEQVKISGATDDEYEVKPFNCIKYRVYFRIIEQGVKSELYFADTFNKGVVIGLAKVLKAQNTRFCELELNSHTYVKMSKQGKEYDVKCWDLEAVFPIDDMSIKALEGAF